MITGELKSQVDAVWNQFWSGGIANPLEVIEQITYLLFLRGLDDRQTAAESKAIVLGGEVENPVFPDGTNGISAAPAADGNGIDYARLRWSRLRDEAPQTMFDLVANHVFPFLRNMGGDGSALNSHMADARFTIPTPGLLARVVDMLDAIPMDRRDTKGDLYEYMLGKIASAGQNGQFRTPRHIIELMVAMMNPTRHDIIADPACGTGGFLVAAGEHLRRTDGALFSDDAAREHFHNAMFHGYDFDRTMLRIGAMNMALHGVDGASIAYKDSLAEGANDDAGRYSLILANPPFAGALDADGMAKDLKSVVDTKKTELLFMALFLRLMQPGGRAAVIVPDGVLFGSSRAHKTIRKLLVEDQKLDAIVKLPSGVFKPYAGVSTAILFFTLTDSGGTEDVWFYDVRADGLSLDDKRNPLVPEGKIGPFAELTDAERPHNDLPDALTRWSEREGSERERPRTAQSFTVPKAEIAAADYDLSINRYREIEHEAVEHRAPKDIIADLKAMEAEITDGLKELEAML